MDTDVNEGRSDLRAKLKDPWAYIRWLKGRRYWWDRSVAPWVLFPRNRRSWAETVRGKTVAVVGPAPLDKDYSDVVEAHDLIVRVGFEHWPWPGTGTRTDVWLLDHGGTRHFINHNIGHEVATDSGTGEGARRGKNLANWHELGTGWVILKGGSPTRLSEFFKFLFHKEFRGTKTRCIFSRQPPFLRLRGLDRNSARTPLNQVPNALFELFLLRPKSVAVFGSDYYTRPGLSYHMSSPSYQTLVDSPTSFITAMVSEHPQLHQKRIVRWIQDRRGWPTGDPLFTRLTALDEEEFLKLYRSW